MWVGHEWVGLEVSGAKGGCGYEWVGLKVGVNMSGWY